MQNFYIGLAPAVKDTVTHQDQLQQVRELVRKNLKRFLDGAVIVESPEKNPVAREMLRVHGIEGSSILRMTLTTENNRLGGIVLTAQGSDRYTNDHVELLSLLKKPFTIALFNTLTHREVSRLRDRLEDDNQYLQEELQRLSGDEIIGADFGLKEVMQLVRQVAPTDSPILLTGETGVGKDVIANAIRLASSRRNRPFIALF